MTQFRQHRHHATGKILGHQARCITPLLPRHEASNPSWRRQGSGSPVPESPPMMPARTSPRSGRGQKWRTVGVDRQPSMMVGNRRVGPLEENDASRFGRGAGDIAQAITRSRSKRSPEFSDMRRKNAVFVDPVEEVLSTLAEHRQGIGIENKRLSGGECRHHEVARSLTHTRSPAPSTPAWTCPAAINPAKSPAPVKA